MKFAHLPLLIQKRMLEHQLSQTGKGDASIFVHNIHANKSSGGFDWDLTLKHNEGAYFWERILINEDFALFFLQNPEKEEFVPGQLIEVSQNNVSWCKRIFFDKTLNQALHKYLCVDPLEEKTFKNGGQISPILWRYAREIAIEFVELTLEDISAGKGVGIDPSRMIIKLPNQSNK